MRNFGGGAALRDVDLRTTEDGEHWAGWLVEHLAGLDMRNPSVVLASCKNPWTKLWRPLCRLRQSRFKSRKGVGIGMIGAVKIKKGTPKN